MKNIYIYFLASTLTLGSSCNFNQKMKTQETTLRQEIVENLSEHNKLTKNEQKEGWLLLFDGETSSGWRGVNKDYFPNGWEVSNGTLHCKGSGKGEAGAKDGGDIIYNNKKFSNFHLKFDWKISEGGNSGIFYLIKEEVEGGPIWKAPALEFQVLDNERHPGAQHDNRKAGSLYDLIPADPQYTKPAGEWNSAEILVSDGTVIHKQNGNTLLEVQLWTDEWEELVASSKFPELNPGWSNIAKSGFIALQDHGDGVWFRNIKLKEF